ncbi:MAG: hypothetical protein RR290_01410 [Clostridia bacterium]
MKMSVDINAIAVQGELLPNKIKDEVVKGITLKVGNDKLPEIKEKNYKVAGKKEKIRNEEDEPII